MGIEIGYGIGALVILAALIYGTMQYSRRNRANAPITEEATKALYKDPDHYEAVTHDALQRKARP